MFYNKMISYANRGMNLENDINLTNKYYIEKDKAIVYKKPTPIKVTKVVYNNLKQATIKEAFYEMPSTTDYNGIYKGKYIDFDAKEVKSNSSFSLSNIHKHQLEHLIRIYKHGGIAFLIVRFCKNNTTYLLEIDAIVNFINKEKRKSIPISYFDEFGYKIKESYFLKVDYIKLIDELYFNNKEDSWRKN